MPIHYGYRQRQAHDTDGEEVAQKEAHNSVQREEEKPNLPQNQPRFHAHIDVFAHAVDAQHDGPADREPRVGPRDVLPRAQRVREDKPDRELCVYCGVEEGRARGEQETDTVCVCRGVVHCV